MKFSAFYATSVKFSEASEVYFLKASKDCQSSKYFVKPLDNRLLKLPILKVFEKSY